jgi:hypothetical protein
MTARLRLLVLASIAASFVFGCSKDNPVSPAGGGGQSPDQSQLTTTATVESQLIDDGFFDTSDQTDLSGSLPGANASGTVAIDPLRFWRNITSATRTFDFAFSDTDSTGRPTVAVVTIHRHFLGTFNIVPADTNGMPDFNNIIHKPLDDHWVRKVRFRRTTDWDDDEDRWRIAAITGADVTSKDATTQIVRIRLQATSLDTTITDPLAFFKLRNVLRFASGDSVTVTATTTRNDDVVLLYAHDHRKRMTNNGDNTYTGVFHAGTWDGWRHFAVNALSHGTLYDDTAPYDSKAWVFPYAVSTMVAVEYIP